MGPRSAPWTARRRRSSAEKLAEIALWHRWLLRTAVPYLFLVAINGLSLFSATARGFEQAVGPLRWFIAVSVLVSWPPLCFQLARALGRSPWLYAALAAVPLVNLGVIAELSGVATRVLRAAGVRVGVLGGSVQPGTVGPYPADDESPFDRYEPGQSPFRKWILIGGIAATCVLVGLVIGVVVLRLLIQGADRRVPPVHDGRVVGPADPNRSPPAKSGRHELSFGGGQVVYWADDTSSDEATGLGEAMRETGYFNGKGEKGVELSRDGESRVVKIYMPSSEVEKSRVKAIMGNYAGVMWGAIAFEGKPLVVKLCDETLAERASYRVEPSSRHQFAPRSYLYHTSTLKAEAERLGQFLSRESDAEAPANWTLTKRGGKWQVCPGVNRDAVTEQVRGEFRQAVRRISDVVFEGQPVELQFYTRDGVETVSVDARR